MPKGEKTPKELYAQVLDYLDQYPDASQAEIGDGIGQSRNSVRNWIGKLREIGAWDPETQTVDRQKFDEWEPGRRRRARLRTEQEVPKADTEERAQAIPKALPDATPEVIRKVLREVLPAVLPDMIPEGIQFNDQEINILKELMEWWEEEGRDTRATPEVLREVIRKVLPEVLRERSTLLPDVIPGVIPSDVTSKSRRSFWIEDALYEVLRQEARRQGLSMADLVNAAIRAFLEGDMEDTVQ